MILSSLRKKYEKLEVDPLPNFPTGQYLKSQNKSELYVPSKVLGENVSSGGSNGRRTPFTSRTSSRRRQNTRVYTLCNEVQ